MRLFGCVGYLHICAYLKDLTPLHYDDKSAICIVRNFIFHEQIKHIETNYHFIGHHLQLGTLSLPFVLSALQITNIFTK